LTGLLQCRFPTASVILSEAKNLDHTSQVALVEERFFPSASLRACVAALLRTSLHGLCSRPDDFDSYRGSWYNLGAVEISMSPTLAEHQARVDYEDIGSRRGGRDSVYAVIETGGKQYKVTEGQTIEVEKLPQEVGETVELDRVLLVVDDDKVVAGTPTVEGAMVSATVLLQARRRKVIVFKYKAKERYRRKKGHRQAFTRLRIGEIRA